MGNIGHTQRTQDLTVEEYVRHFGDQIQVFLDDALGGIRMVRERRCPANAYEGTGAQFQILNTVFRNCHCTTSWGAPFVAVDDVYICFEKKDSYVDNQARTRAKAYPSKKLREACLPA